MRIKHKAYARIAEDSEMKNLLFGPDDSLAEVVVDTYQRQASGSFAILANTSETLSLGDITETKGLYLRVDGDATVKLNGSADAIQLRKGSTLTGTFAKLFLEADISSVEVTAPTTVAVNGVYCVWGDASA